MVQSNRQTFHSHNFNKLQGGVHTMIYIIIFFCAHWYLSLFTQSFFHHRYAAHGMFTMSCRWEKIFFILSGIFQGSSYLSPKAYGIMHRMHHAYTDTDKDPHSPKNAKNLIEFMLQTKKRYTDILYGQEIVEDKFSKNVPCWDAADRFFDHWRFRIGWAILCATFYIVFAPMSWWSLLLILPLIIQYIMGPVHGAIINWGNHKWGYTNFKLDNTSKNFLPWDIVMWGESLHNNHHRFPGIFNFANKWFEFDPMALVIKWLDRIKVIHLSIV